ncbi:MULTISPECIES: hypothetical protein [unclassified Maridesulfovibrio]|uniref:capsular polysaccharide export protein, LipB/KpsS family n=1 Tax=unclassified Maridesulfovibrio TaxID=2794999 RepID=UPI003B3D2F85
MTSILFHARARRDIHFIDAIEKLKDKYEIVVVADDQSYSSYENIDGINLERHNVTIQDLEKIPENDLERLPQIEALLGTNCFKFSENYLLYNKYVRRYATEYAYAKNLRLIPQTVYSDFVFLERIIKKYNVEYAFFETLDLPFTMVLKGMAENGIIKQAFEGESLSLGDGMRFRIATGQHRRSKKIEYYFEKEKTKEAIIWAQKLVADYCKEKKGNSYDDYFVNIANPYTRYSFHELIDKFKRVLKGESFYPALIHNFNRFRSLPYFSKSLPDTRIISYFLQLTPEATMLSQVPEVSDQEYLIEQMAICGKHGYTVVVKEHPICFGNRPSSFYKELSYLPNVVLLPPAFPARDVLLKSEAVVVASGTSLGHEAIIAGKPLICLGDPYYNICENNVKISHPKEVWDALDQISITEKAQIKFLAAVYDATYEYPDFISFADQDQNRNIGPVIAEALNDEIQMYEKGLLS